MVLFASFCEVGSIHVVLSFSAVSIGSSDCNNFKGLIGLESNKQIMNEQVRLKLQQTTTRLISRFKKFEQLFQPPKVIY